MSSYKIAAVSLALVCASLGVSACERSEVPSVDEAPTANAIPAPVTVEKAALPELSPEQLTVSRFAQLGVGLRRSNELKLMQGKQMCGHTGQANWCRWAMLVSR